MERSRASNARQAQYDASASGAATVSRLAEAKRGGPVEVNPVRESLGKIENVVFSICSSSTLVAQLSGAASGNKVCCILCLSLTCPRSLMDKAETSKALIGSIPPRQKCDRIVSALSSVVERPLYTRKVGVRIPQRAHGNDRIRYRLGQGAGCVAISSRRTRSISRSLVCATRFKFEIVAQGLALIWRNFLMRTARADFAQVSISILVSRRRYLSFF